MGLPIYAGTMALTPAGLSTSSRRYDCCEGLSSSTRRRVATLRRSGSKTCPASPHPIRRPHAIIFRPFRSSPNSSTMHFMQFPFYRPLASATQATRLTRRLVLRSAQREGGSLGVGGSSLSGIAIASTPPFLLHQWDPSIIPCGCRFCESLRFSFPHFLPHLFPHLPEVPRFLF